MRINAQKWIDAGLTPTTAEWINFDGLMNKSGTAIVIPRSDEALMDCMIGHGLNVKQTNNRVIFEETAGLLGSIKSNDLRLFTNGFPLLSVGNCVLQSSLLVPFNKSYKRQKDCLHIFQGEDGDALGLTRMVSPCKDWWFVFAAYGLDPLNDKRVPTKITLEDFNGDEEDEL